MTEKHFIHSIRVNIPRTRVFDESSACDLKKTKKKKIKYDKTIKKPSDNTLRIYSLPCNKPVGVNSLKKDVMLLPLKLYAKKQELYKTKQRAAIKLREAYKIMNTNLRNRLYVEDPPNEVQAVTDIDKSYFRYLNNHRASRYIPLYKSLKLQFHERLRMRQEIGYKLDYIVNVEENYRKEQDNYEISVHKLADQVKHFDVFIAKDYKKSMLSLKRCEELTVKVNEELILRENLAIQQFTIQSRLIVLDFLYLVQQKYGRFLYYLSPPSWRAKHREIAHSIEIEAKGFDLGTNSEEDTFNVIFQNMAKECSTGLVKPVLYFLNPSDLMKMFESMELQHLNHFSHVSLLSSRAMEVNKTINILKKSIRLDTAYVTHLIDEFVQLVTYCEVREAQLKAKFMKILSGLFHDTVVAPDVLKLQLNLEFYYQKLYREESLNKSCLTTAKALEDLYMEYLFELDNLTTDNLTVSMKRCIEKEERQLRRAQNASRELRSFQMMERALLRAFEKPSPTKQVSTMAIFPKRTSISKVKQSIIKPTTRVINQQYSLTDAEKEYLRLFTDWTENEDPSLYIRSPSLILKHYSTNK